MPNEKDNILTPETVASLIKMADKFDQEGKYDMAAEVDKTLKSLAVGPDLSPELRILRGQLRMAMRDNDGLHIENTLAKGEFINKLKVQIGEEKVSALISHVYDGDFALAYELLGFDKKASLTSTAARQKVIFDTVSDNKKKHLMKFLNQADSKIQSSLKDLNEFFACLRYLDKHEEKAVKNLNIDEVMNALEMSKRQLESAKSSLYTGLVGKRPGKNSIETFIGDPQMLADFFADDDEEDKKPKEEGLESEEEIGDEDIEEEKEEEDEKEDEAKDTEHCEQCAKDCAGECACHDQIDEKDLEGFWQEEEV